MGQRFSSIRNLIFNNAEIGTTVPRAEDRVGKIIDGRLSHGGVPSPKVSQLLLIMRQSVADVATKCCMIFVYTQLCHKIRYICIRDPSAAAPDEAGMRTAPSPMLNQVAPGDPDEARTGFLYRLGVVKLLIFSKLRR